MKVTPRGSTTSPQVFGSLQSGGPRLAVLALVWVQTFAAGCSSGKGDDGPENIVSVSNWDEYTKVYCEGQFVTCWATLYAWFEYVDGMHHDAANTSLDSCFMNIGWSTNGGNSSPLTLIPRYGTRADACWIPKVGYGDAEDYPTIAWAVTDCRGNAGAGSVTATATDASGNRGRYSFTIDQQDWNGAAVKEYTYCSSVPSELQAALP
jgi:hypothetical protein